MQNDKTAAPDASRADPNLLRLLNRGLEDLEAGRTLPHQEAVEEIRRIREQRAGKAFRDSASKNRPAPIPPHQGNGRQGFSDVIFAAARLLIP